MTPLLWWGLPSSRDDELLFGGEPPWPAARYQIDAELAQLRARQAGADTDLNPLTQRDQIVNLTADDAARVEILRRYRLFSRQPDEMITLRALQRMNPRKLDFDPRLYQYGGGYIYAVGAALGTAALTGFLRITSDAAFYLDHPAAFARFYVVARSLSLLCGALALLAVYRLARRAGGRTAGWIALTCAALTPGFITGVLEAKPHLPSACVLLWATSSALDYLARRRVGDLVRSALLAGYAFALVLTGIAAAALAPALVWAGARRSPRGRPRPVNIRHLMGAVALAAGVWLLANPYVPYNALFNRAALGSNVANSTAMYANQVARAAQGAVRVGQLLVEAGGAGLLVAGGLGLVLLWRRYPREVLLPASVGAAMLLMAVLTGAGKPAEFGRFLILPVLLLATSAGVLLAALLRRRALTGFVVTLAVLLTMRTPAYIHAFAADTAGTHESRYLAAVYLREHLGPADTLGVVQEPAPYAIPPLDFAHRTVLWLPPEPPVSPDSAPGGAATAPTAVRTTLPDWLVLTADDERVHADAWWQPRYRLAQRIPPPPASLSPISWANKPVFIYRHEAGVRR
jgi:hypothetical protein